MSAHSDILLILIMAALAILVISAIIRGQGRSVRPSEHDDDDTLKPWDDQD